MWEMHGVVFQLLNELSGMQSSVSELSQRLQHEMGRRLQEREQHIKAQREQVSIRSRSAVAARRDYVRRGSDAEGQPLFRISCICYTG